VQSDLSEISGDSLPISLDIQTERGGEKESEREQHSEPVQFAGSLRTVFCGGTRHAYTQGAATRLGETQVTLFFWFWNDQISHAMMCFHI